MDLATLPPSAISGGRIGIVIERIVSGGQTGADRAGLEAAITLGLRHGGWCPRGRRAEDGEIPARYSLVEVPSDTYDERTRLNVRDSDGTVVFTRGPLAGGSRLTAEEALRIGKPCLLLDSDRIAPGGGDAVRELLEWIDQYRIRVLNVAGPRESQAPGIERAVASFVTSALGG
jgi:hypothetical protein